MVCTNIRIRGRTKRCTPVAELSVLQWKIIHRDGVIAAVIGEFLRRAQVVRCSTLSVRLMALRPWCGATQPARVSASTSLVRLMALPIQRSDAPDRWLSDDSDALPGPTCCGRSAPLPTIGNGSRESFGLRAHRCHADNNPIHWSDGATRAAIAIPWVVAP
jgi:hypothetical protein